MSAAYLHYKLRYCGNLAGFCFIYINDIHVEHCLEAKLKPSNVIAQQQVDDVLSDTQIGMQLFIQPYGQATPLDFLRETVSFLHSIDYSRCLPLPAVPAWA